MPVGEDSNHESRSVAPGAWPLVGQHCKNRPSVLPFQPSVRSSVWEFENFHTVSWRSSQNSTSTSFGEYSFAQGTERLRVASWGS